MEYQSLNPNSGEIWICPSDQMPMIFIPPGQFLMGSKKPFVDRANNRWEPPKCEQPVHEVYLDGFWIDQHPVTVGQFLKFCKATGYRMPRQPFHVYLDRANWLNYPVVNVNWFDAIEYAKWAGKSLPTEAQWEKAARGGLEQALYPWGDEPVDDTKVPPSLRGVVPVMRYPPNGYGLFDVVGHIYQWCWDWFDSSYYQHQPIGGWRNPSGPEEGLEKVLRGGCWYEVGIEADFTFRVSARFHLPPQCRYLPGLEGAKIAAIGFRCVINCAHVP